MYDSKKRTICNIGFGYFQLNKISDEKSIENIFKEKISNEKSIKNSSFFVKQKKKKNDSKLGVS